MLMMYYVLFGNICVSPRTPGLGVVLVLPFHSMSVRILAVFSMLKRGWV